MSSHSLNPVLITTALVWNKLDDSEKAALHLAVNWPGRSLLDIEGADKVRSLATNPDGSAHQEIVDAVNQLAAEWHR